MLSARQQKKLTTAYGMLEKLEKAYEALTDGGAQSYQVGTRNWTGFELRELREEISYWEKVIDALEGTIKRRGRGVVTVVPRDL